MRLETRRKGLINYFFIEKQNSRFAIACKIIPKILVAIMQHLYNCNNRTILLHNCMILLHCCMIMALCVHSCIVCMNFPTQAHDQDKFTAFLQILRPRLNLVTIHILFWLWCKHYISDMSHIPDVAWAISALMRVVLALIQVKTCKVGFGKIYIQLCCHKTLITLYVNVLILLRFF